MSAKRTVLESLTRQRLIDLAYAFDADFGPTGLSKDKLIDGCSSPAEPKPSPSDYRFRTHSKQAITNR